MKKLFLVFMLVIVIIVAGCNNDDNTNLNKEQINKAILTKEIEDTIKEDFNNYEYKEKYRYVIYPNVRCYGIYNKAVVMFILLPADVEKRECQLGIYNVVGVNPTL